MSWFVLWSLFFFSSRRRHTRGALVTGVQTCALPILVARRVFFSFHYDRDVRRVVQVRNSWVVRPGGEAQPFYDKAEFEEAKKRAGGKEKWIEEQLKDRKSVV